MKELIKELKIQRADFQERINRIDNAINAFQDVCTHRDEKGEDAYESIGHDSHHDHYECSICGKRTYV